MKKAIYVLSLVFTSSIFLSEATFGKNSPIFEAQGSDLGVRYELQLNAPWGQIMKVREKGKSYDGSLQIRPLGGGDQKWESFNMAVSLRGTTSLAEEECPFAKLEITLKDPLSSAFLGNHRSFKVATHCGEEEAPSSAGRIRNKGQAVGAEYLVYKFMDILEMEHQMVELVQITYVDSNIPQSARTRPGFFLEDKSSVAARIGGKIVNYKSDLEIEEGEAAKASFTTTIQEKIEPLQVAMAHLFVTFVGNNDFILPITEKIMDPDSLAVGIKNVFFVQTTSGITPIPQDFDLAGSVTGVVPPSMLWSCNFAPQNRQEEARIFVDTKVQQLKDIMLSIEPTLAAVFPVAVSQFRKKISDLVGVIGLAYEKKIITQEQQTLFMLYANEMIRALSPEILQREKPCIWNSY